MRSVPRLAGLMLAASVLAVTPAIAGGKGNSDGHGNSGSSGASGSGGGSGASGSGASSGAPSLPLCKLSDLSVEASACGGFFQGNLLSNSGTDITAQTSALSSLGLTGWSGGLIEPQMNLSSSLVDFSTALYGVTYIGIHFGAGASSPSPGTSGGVTAFYRFDAGANLDSFTLAYGSASAARLYSTQAAPIVPPTAPTPPIPPIELPTPGGSSPLSSIIPVPEPSTWLLMILGFGGVGAVLRAGRRRSVV